MSKNPLDVTILRPGHRVTVRDWRDDRLYPGTFIAHIAEGGARTAVFPPNVPPSRRGRFRIAVFRDFFVGDRLYLPTDVREILAAPADAERSRWLVSIVEAEAKQCAQCRSFGATLRREGAHDRSTCAGITAIPELLSLADLGRIS